jgi:hypothetical protein
MEVIIENIKKFFMALNGRLVRWYRKLPEGKKYAEFITALLSVPVMITVIILNMNNLNQSKQNALKVVPTTAPIEVVITTAMQKPDNRGLQPQNNLTPTLIPSPTITPTLVQCKKEVGPVDVIAPQEGQIISNNNFCIKIATNSSYCASTLAYQLDNGNWSDYTAGSICLYNLSSGNHTLQLKVKNTESEDIVTLKRNFIYQNPNVTPSATPIPSPTITSTP